MSTGLSRRVIVKDAETGRTQTYSTGSDVLAQQFAVRVGPMLYCDFFFPPTSRTNTRTMTSIPLPTQVPVLFNGCRSGEIFSIDLRQRGRRDNSRKASRFHQESAITSLHIMRDENYLIAADMQGQVRAFSLLSIYGPVQSRGMTPHLSSSSCFLSCTDQAVGRASDQISAGVQGAPQ